MFKQEARNFMTKIKKDTHLNFPRPLFFQYFQPAHCTHIFLHSLQDHTTEYTFPHIIFSIASFVIFYFEELSKPLRLFITNANWLLVRKQPACKTPSLKSIPSSSLSKGQIRVGRGPYQKLILQISQDRHTINLN